MPLMTYAKQNTAQPTRSLKTRTLRRASMAAMILAAGSMSVGCVSQQKYDDLFEANRTLRSRNAEMQSQLDEAMRTAGSLRGEAGGAGAAANELRNSNAMLRQQLANAENTISDLEDRLNSLSMVSLPVDVDASLRELASQYPGLLTYDASRGMIRFASDLTFGLGSANLTDGAKQSLRQLAAVLNASSVSSYTIRVVGHTDSIAISDRIRNQFPTNVHLSVARSISVRGELERLGVAGNRMQAAGWGPYRPMVPNNANGITPQNRRVEIFIVSPGNDADRGGLAGSAGAVSAPVNSTTAEERADPTFVPMK